MRKPAQRIGDAGPTLEIANEGSYCSRHVKPYPYYMLRGPGEQLTRIKEGEADLYGGRDDSEEVVRRYE